MKKIWVRAVPWDKKIVTTALESGADGIMAPNGFSDKVRIKTTFVEDWDLQLPEDVQ